MEAPPKFIKTKSRKKKEMLLVEDVYLFNLIKINKDNTKLFIMY